jgi:hypothetical protein
LERGTPVAYILRKSSGSIPFVRHVLQIVDN